MVLRVSTLLLTTIIVTATLVQERSPSQVSASARLQARVAEAVVSATKEPAVFVVAAYPKDANEHSLMQGNGVLMVSVFGRNEKETKVRSVSLQAANGASELPLSRTVKRNEADTPAVIRKLGESRRNYFYILPPTAIAGGTLEVQFEQGGTLREPLAQHPLGYQPSSASEENGAFLRGLKMLAAREFPDYPFNMRVRVSQGVLAGNLLRQVSPRYPQEAREQRISGPVAMRIVVGTDGKVQEIEPVEGPPILMDPAIAAVRQWVYKPYYLNGSTVEVETRIVVNFNLK